MTPISTASFLELALRVGLALLVGAIVGINRDLSQKPIGLRTLGMVSLGSCLLVLTVSQYAVQNGFNSSDAASRVTQGIVSGIGFLGAGTIIRGRDTRHVYGLTTAAAIWAVAALGIACALAEWPILVIGFVAILALLVLGGPLERRIELAVERRSAAERKAKTLPPP